jgi:hypothetical protein
MKLLFLLFAFLFVTPSNAQQKSKDPDGPLVYGDFNLGYSNYGISGEASLNYQESNGLYSLAYYKSHLCYTGNYNGIPFPNTGTDQHHMAVSSLSISRGFLFGKKRASAISIGLSATKFVFEETESDHDKLSISGFWDAIIGSDPDHNVTSSRTHIVMGIPVAFRRQFGGQHSIGWVAGIKADFNPERVFVAATLGLRFGKAK